MSLLFATLLAMVQLANAIPTDTEYERPAYSQPPTKRDPPRQISGTANAEVNKNAAPAPLNKTAIIIIAVVLVLAALVLAAWLGWHYLRRRERMARAPNAHGSAAPLSSDKALAAHHEACGVQDSGHGSAADLAAPPPLSQEKALAEHHEACGVDDSAHGSASDFAAPPPAVQPYDFVRGTEERKGPSWY